MPKLSVSIINYRTADLTLASLESVRDDMADRNFSVVVVDNASNDGSAEKIEAWIRRAEDSRFQLVRSKVNSGFSAGHNLGFASNPDADFFLVLNSDAMVRSGFFDEILQAAEEQPDFGMFMPQLENEDGTPQVSCFRFHSVASEFLRGVATGPVTKILKRYVVATSEPLAPNEIEWASFACILLRGKMVREIGPMDEGYFLYFEDTEYSLRARRAGWRIRFVPNAHVAHLSGRSGPVGELTAKKKRLPAYFWRSRTRYLRQAYGPAGPLLGNSAWILGRVLSQGRWLAGKAPFAPIEREWSDMWLGFLDPLRPDMEPRK